MADEIKPNTDPDKGPSNKTVNYDLAAWVKTDRPRMVDFNKDNLIIDKELKKLHDNIDELSNNVDTKDADINRLLNNITDSYNNIVQEFANKAANIALVASNYTTMAGNYNQLATKYNNIEKLIDEMHKQVRTVQKTFILHDLTYDKDRRIVTFLRKAVNSSDYDNSKGYYNIDDPITATIDFNEVIPKLTPAGEQTPGIISKDDIRDLINYQINKLSSGHSNDDNTPIMWSKNDLVNTIIDKINNNSGGSDKSHEKLWSVNELNSGIEDGTINIPRAGTSTFGTVNYPTIDSRVDNKVTKDYIVNKIKSPSGSDVLDTLGIKNQISDMVSNGASGGNIVRNITNGKTSKQVMNDLHLSDAVHSSITDTVSADYIVNKLAPLSASSDDKANLLDRLNITDDINKLVDDKTDSIGAGLLSAASEIQKLKDGQAGLGRVDINTPSKIDTAGMITPNEVNTLAGRVVANKLADSNTLANAIGDASDTKKGLVNNSMIKDAADGYTAYNIYDDMDEGHNPTRVINMKKEKSTGVVQDTKVIFKVATFKSIFGDKKAPEHHD